MSFLGLAVVRLGDGRHTKQLDDRFTEPLAHCHDTSIADTDHPRDSMRAGSD
jgi:hypothetical protein